MKFLINIRWVQIFFFSLILTACGINFSLNDFSSRPNPPSTPTPPQNLTAWGIDGLLKPQIGQYGSLFPTDIARQPNSGTIILHDRGEYSLPLLIRYLPNGQVDTAFGTKGFLEINFTRSERDKPWKMGVSNNYIYFLVEQGMGDGSPSIKRFSLTDGKLDLLFGSGGVASPITGLFYPRYFRVHSDESLTFAGHSNISNYKVRFIRVKADGSLDSSYGTAGEFTYDSALPDLLSNVILTSDNKYLVAVQSQFTNSTLSIFQVNADGTLDTSNFATSSGGVLSTTISNNHSFSIIDMTELSDHSFLMTGGRSPCNGCSPTPLAIKVTPSGAFDTDFDSDGYLYAPVPGLTRTSAYRGAFEDSSGNLILVGSQDSEFWGGSITPFASRINFTTGALDTSFGTSGHQVGLVSEPANSMISSIHKVENELWALAHRLSPVSPPYSASLIMNVLPDLQLNNSFGTNGVTETLGPPGTPLIYRMASAANGKTLATGWLDGFFDYTYISRLLPDGTPDPGFGYNGAIVDLFKENPFAIYEIFEVRELANKQIVVVAEAEHLNRQYFVAAKFNSNGSRDLSFGVGGIAMMDSTDYADLFSATIDSSGASMAVTYSNDSTIGSTALKLNASGLADTTFGNNGIVEGLKDPNDSWISPMFMAPHPDGSWIISGYGQGDGAPWEVWTFFFKIKSNGELDSNFDGDGYVTYMNKVNTDYTPQGLGISTTGTIYSLAATGDTPTNHEAHIIAVNPQGGLEQTFGANGVVVAKSGFFVDTNAWQMNALRLVGNDIYVLGLNETHQFVLKAINSLGAPVPSFGNNGYLEVDPGPHNLAYSRHRSWFWDNTSGSAKVLYDDYVITGILRVQPNGELK